MDAAQRDQAQAGAADWAESMQIHYRELRGRGFTSTEAKDLLVALILQGSGVIQAQALDRMVERLSERDDDE